jgi:hypothetical protein
MLQENIIEINKKKIKNILLETGILAGCKGSFLGPR